MIELDWKFGYNKVLSFEDGVSHLDMNNKGFILIASIHGKVTNICYDNILQLYNRFKRIYNSQNPLNIKYFTFAFYDNDEKSKVIISCLKKSLYHNPDYKLICISANVPFFIKFEEKRI